MIRRAHRGAAFAIALLAVTACTNQPSPEVRGSLRVTGASVARDAVERLGAVFFADHPEIRLRHLPSAHSADALRALRAGEVDVAYLARDPDPEERRGLFVYPFAKDPIALVAHRGTGVQGLSTQQLRDLYSGKIRNWADLGGADQPVVVLDRPEFTSAKRVLRAGPLGGLEVHPEATVLEGQDLMDSALETYPGALGYTSLRSALALGDRVDVLRLDHAYPDLEAVRRGNYRLARSLCFVVRDQFSPQTRAFLEHASSAEGRSALEARALLPLRREILVAVPPVRNIVALERQYGGLARYLQERLGRPVELVHQPSYTAIVDAFRTNRVDAAFLGSFTYLLAHLEAGVEVLARPEHRGSSHYRGVLYVRQESPYRRVEDLRGARVAHAGIATTAGYLFPLCALRARGLPPPAAFFGAFAEAGSHEAALRAVLEGRADAAAAKDEVLAEMLREEPSLKGRLRELAASPPVPSNGFAAGPLLSPELREQIRGLLLALDQSPRGRKALQDLGAERFLPTTDDDYANLYDMAGAVAPDLADFFQYR